MIYGSLSALIPILIGAIRFNTLNRSLRILLIWLSLSLLSDIVCYQLASNGINSLWVINLFDIAESVCFFFLFYGELSNKLSKLFPVITFILFAMVWVYFNHSIPLMSNFNQHPKTLKSIIITIGSGIALLQLSNRELNLLRSNKFWTMAGLFLYFSVSIVIFFSSKIIVSNDHFLMYFTWNALLLLTIICNLLFSIAFSCSNQKI